VSQEGQDVQHLVTRVDELVQQMTGLTDNLKQAINPEDLRKTMRQLNQTLENASKTLAPEGGLNKTAQRTLAKLEDSIEQLRDLMTRVNRGEGSVGMLLNDPSYAQEIREAIRNVNRLLTKVGDMRFVVDLGAAQLSAYDGGRGWFNLAIWPRPDRYYLLGLSTDPRGRLSNTTVTTTAGGTTQTTQTQVVDQTGLLLTGMLGKVFFNRYDFSVGALYGDGTVSLGLNLGPSGHEEMVQLRNDVYSRSSTGSVDDRLTLTVQPWSGVYLRAGLESFRNHPTNGKTVFLIGAGLRFDDEDIKLLFTLK
jgi:phospholipid/cholesterol/gamma-HCH transport system substrate-binding protein